MSIMRGLNSKGEIVPIRTDSAYDADKDVLKVSVVDSAQSGGSNAGAAFNEQFGADMNTNQRALSRTLFMGPSLDTDKWRIKMPNGWSYSFGTKSMDVATGTANGDRFELTSVNTIKLPGKVAMNVLGNRKAFQDQIMELVSVDPITKLPDEKTIIRWRCNGGLGNNQAYLELICNGTTLISTLHDIKDFSANNIIFEIMVNDENITFNAKDINTHNSGMHIVKNSYLPSFDTEYALRFVIANSMTVSSGHVQFYMAQFLSFIDTIASSVDSAPSKNISAKVITDTVSGAAAGSDIDLVCTSGGVLIVKPYGPSGAHINSNMIITDNVAHNIASSAPDSSYITSCQLQNTGTVGTEFALSDGGNYSYSYYWRCFLPPSMDRPVTVQFPMALKCNSSVYAQCMTAGANVYMNAQGYKA